MPNPAAPFRALIGAPLPPLGEEGHVLRWLDQEMVAPSNPDVELYGTDELAVIQRTPTLAPVTPTESIAPKKSSSGPDMD